MTDELVIVTTSHASQCMAWMGKLSSSLATHTGWLQEGSKYSVWTNLGNFNAIYDHFFVLCVSEPGPKHPSISNI